ncbi:MULTISPECIES: flagellar export chaperone FliS [Exiguobacterium]|uniref:flagellar export chaperone FliS n=1 Tax=Exiguobacterium TaxID=33986 RepID=UPI00093BF616|nr:MULTISPECIES: flagellar export chaperone FliS [Exiguobacterium]QLQ21426.1 MAG: flagellar export chaperone FliS [Paracoccaceae bacterium]QPI68485.1 flagellar export chaperone FliS [Exiguobacterium sp. PBE]MBG0917671.1 flagellar export chaperone FliS [Exiguobacterium sp. SRB7LM]MCV9899970.1 flagellar export chaperone FliS [Exiguobacterium sp. N5]MDT0192213.1 flagellar export chaperone FliS [Exiguobacterium sp. BG5(2022)]
MVANPYAAYQNNAVTTANPQELTLMLYDGALKFMRLAKLAIDQGNPDLKNVNIQKTQAIFRELRLTLNKDIAVSANLDSLYDYMWRRLVDANVKNDTAILDEVLDFTTELRDTWKEAMKLAKQS